MLSPPVWFLTTAFLLPSACVLRALHSRPVALIVWGPSIHLFNQCNLLKDEPVSIVLIISLSCSYTLQDSPIAGKISPNSAACKVCREDVFSVKSIAGHTSTSPICVPLLSYCQIFAYLVLSSVNAFPISVFILLCSYNSSQMLPSLWNLSCFLQSVVICCAFCSPVAL